MKNLKIRTKLFIQVIFLLAGLGLIGVISLIFMDKINNGSTVISDNWMPSVIAAGDLDTLTSNFRIKEMGHVIAQRTMVLIIGIFVIISIIVSVYIVLSITRPVRELDEVAQKIADGNLNEAITYKSKDELGKLAVSFNKKVVRLRDYVNYINLPRSKRR